MNIKEYLPVVENWPVPGVNFVDICGLLHKPAAFETLIDWAADACNNNEIQATSIVAIESRGFLFAAPIANKLQVPLILVRKPNKLPGEVYSIEYTTEYSTDKLSIQKSAPLGPSPVIVDDVLATGGTICAVAELLRTHWTVDYISAVVPIVLKFLPGLEVCNAKSIDINYYTSYE